jgi:hypothetical protein
MLVVLTTMAICSASCRLEGKELYTLWFKVSITNREITLLTADTWADGNGSFGDKWFKFTATADAQFIHCTFGTWGSLQVFDSSGTRMEPYFDFGSDIYNGGMNKIYVTRGSDYYIRVSFFGNYFTDNYRIAFNETIYPPAVTELTLGTWADGEFTARGEQWFKFTATASTQYIHVHVSLGTNLDLDVYVYDSNGVTVGTWYNTSISVTSGQGYYIKVTSRNRNTGTYHIAFSTSSTPPP